MLCQIKIEPTTKTFWKTKVLQIIGYFQGGDLDSFWIFVSTPSHYHCLGYWVIQSFSLYISPIIYENLEIGKNTSYKQRGHWFLVFHTIFKKDFFFFYLLGSVCLVSKLIVTAIRSLYPPPPPVYWVYLRYPSVSFHKIVVLSKRPCGNNILKNFWENFHSKICKKGHFEIGLHFLTYVRK